MDVSPRGRDQSRCTPLLAEPHSPGNEKTGANLAANFSPEDHAAVFAAAVLAVLESTAEEDEGSTCSPVASGQPSTPPRGPSKLSAPAALCRAPETMINASRTHSPSSTLPPGERSLARASSYKSSLTALGTKCRPVCVGVDCGGGSLSQGQFGSGDRARRKSTAR